jgi:ArsR family transcriptional regulator, lead/cadmium/zinc/bismuth-responsive transcriptional repressor
MSQKTSSLQMLSQSEAERAAEMFSAFADSTRLKLLHALSGGELCVGDLAELLGVSVSAVSHQLRGLRALRLVRGRRDGKMMFYSLDDDHVLSLLDVGLQHASERNRNASVRDVSTRNAKTRRIQSVS